VVVPEHARIGVEVDLGDLALDEARLALLVEPDVLDLLALALEEGDDVPALARLRLVRVAALPLVRAGAVGGEGQALDGAALAEELLGVLDEQDPGGGGG
jgi:hypothetical protein